MSAPLMWLLLGIWPERQLQVNNRRVQVGGRLTICLHACMFKYTHTHTHTTEICMHMLFRKHHNRRAAWQFTKFELAPYCGTLIWCMYMLTALYFKYESAYFIIWTTIKMKTNTMSMPIGLWHINAPIHPGTHKNTHAHYATHARR